MPVKKKPAKKAEAKYTIIKGSEVLSALQNAFAQFEYNKRQKKYILSGDKAKVDQALELAAKFEAIAGKLNPGADKIRQAIQKING